jgi:hypothetical protein
MSRRGFGPSRHDDFYSKGPSMLNLSNEADISKLVIGALKNTIREHGPIHDHRDNLRSAAKRIVGAIKTEIYNAEVTKIKKNRD